MTRIGAAAFGALLLMSAPLAAQKVPDDSGQAKAVAVSRRSNGFVVARYVEVGSRSFYGAQRIGSVMVLGGLTNNSRTHVTTGIFGVGSVIRSRGVVRLSAFVAGATSAEGESLREYLLPSATLGALSISATMSAYQPLGRSRIARQVALNPLTVGLRVRRGSKLGFATTIDVAEGRDVRAAAGPYAQARVPGGSVSMEWMTWGLRARREVRWGFSASY